VTDYSIEKTNGRIVVRGSVPVEDMATLTKLWAKQGYDTLAVGVGSALGVTMAICHKDDLEAWQKEVEAQAAQKAAGDAEKEWLFGPDTGISSKTIMSVLSTGAARIGAEVSLGRWGADVPHDPSDFGRCYRLLQTFPQWRDRLNEVAAKFPKWEPMVREWDRMTSLWEEEAPTGKCPKLYDLMQKLQGRRK